MALDEWHEQYLASITAPLEDLTVEDTRTLLAYFAFDEVTSRFTMAFRRLIDGTDNDQVLRYYELGIGVKTAQLAAEHAGMDATSVERQDERHPDLAALTAMAKRIVRTPDVRMLHAYAQASLLNAIQRMAETAENVEDVRLLADAYLTLPPPGEDDLGDGE